MTGSKIFSAGSSFSNSVNKTEKTGKLCGQISESVSEFHLNLQESLYEHIDKYANWLAAQSQDFYLTLEDGTGEQQSMPLFFDKEQLDQRKGHWFDLFRPPDLEELTQLHQDEETTLFCSFNRQAIEKLRAPAYRMSQLVKEQGTSRTHQVLKESALPEFISFLDELQQLITIGNNEQ